MTKIKETKVKLKKDLIVEALWAEGTKGRHSIAKQKSRAEVRGGGAKPYSQKGTGRARQGSIRAIQWVGGGRAFGTSLRNHKRQINRKVRRAAMENLLEWKQAEGKLLINELKLEKPSTKTFVKYLDDNGVAGKVLFLYDSEEGTVNIVKSARNIKKVKCLHVDRINIKDLLDYEWLVMVPAIAEYLKLNAG